MLVNGQSESLEWSTERILERGRPRIALSLCGVEKGTYYSIDVNNGTTSEYPVCRVTIYTNRAILKKKNGAEKYLTTLIQCSGQIRKVLIE